MKAALDKSGNKLAEAEATIRALQQELAESNRGLVALNLELDERVRQRTAELAQANQSLQVEIAERQRAEEEINRHNAVLQGINSTLEAALACRTEEDLGAACLEVAERLTQSRFGFIGELNDRELHDIAVSDPGWNACSIIQPAGHKKPPGNLKIHGLYGRVLLGGKGFFTNDPTHHPDRIGLPPGHPPLESFLGVPLIREGRVIGMIGVGNRPGGYTLTEQQILETLARAIVEAFMRKRAEEGLRDSEERFRLLFEGVKDCAIFMLDPDGKVANWNLGAQQMKGYSTEEIVGRPFTCFYTPEDLALDMPARELAVARERGQTNVEGWRVRKDGSRFWAEVSITVLHDGDGQLRGYAKVTRDITARKHAEQQLQQLNSTLEQRVAERTVEIKQLVDQLRALAAELVNVEQKERRRLAQILHDHLQQLLVGAKFGVSIIRVKTTEKDIRQTADQLAETLDEAIRASRSLSADLSPPVLHEKGLTAGLQWLGRQMHEKHGIGVKVDVNTAAEPEAEQIRLFLFEAVRELLLNAVKHSKVGSVSVATRVLKSGEVQVEVADKGVGFDPAQLGTAASGAGGFGLFSIRERLNYLGGHLKVEAAPGKGSRFVLTAPARLAATQGEPRSAGTQLSAAPRPPAPARSALPKAGRTIRVILADDHPVLRQGLARLLQEQPDIHVVGEAGDGQAAVDLVRQLKPDVVLMDVTMPVISGLDATRQIVSEHPDTRVIALSMHEETDMAASMRDAGAFAYLTKGGPTEHLIAVIRACRAD